MKETKRFNHGEVAMTDKRKVYEEKCDVQLKEWSAEIVLLNARADKAKAEAKVEYYKTVETLQGKQDAAKMKLQELRTVGDDAWEDVKTGAENVWAEVKTAFQSAASRFKGKDFGSIGPTFTAPHVLCHKNGE